MDGREVLAERVKLDGKDGNGSSEAQHALADSDTQDGRDGAAAGILLVTKKALAMQGYLSSESGAQQLMAQKIISSMLNTLRTTHDLLPLINK
ncbi:hypothetical protein LPJ61_005247, partial [Coemansia biformis]